MKLSRITGALIAAGAALPLAGLSTPAAHAGRVQASSAPAASAAPVSAQGGCDWTGCSEIQNRSNRSVRVARDWCGSGGNGTVVTEASRRGPLACRTNAYKSLRPGQHSYTSAWHDTDAFGVSGGCRMAVQWNLDGQESGPIKYYAPPRGTNYWVKVSNIYDIDIESYTC